MEGRSPDLHKREACDAEDRYQSDRGRRQGGWRQRASKAGHVKRRDLCGSRVRCASDRKAANTGPGGKSHAAAHTKPQSWSNWRVMRLLVAVSIMMGTSVAHAQNGGTLPTSPGYQPYPQAYPATPPNGSAEQPPDQGPITEAPGGDARSLARETLTPQNAVRALFGEPPLRWSGHLADVAQDWADHLVATGQFAHRPEDPYGENLFETTGGTASPSRWSVPGLMKPAPMT